MALWGKKKLKDVAIKYLQDSNATVELNNGKVSFELYLENGKYSLFPYLDINEEASSMSFIINIRKVDDIEAILYQRLNSFNVKSKLLTAKLNSDGVIYLEYNSMIEVSSIKDEIKAIVENVFLLSDEIDLL